MRYLLLVLLNMPVIILALVNIITQYKLKKISLRRFRWQLIIWIAIIAILVLSFPIYNIIVSNDIFDSTELSLFDIVEVTAIVWLFYSISYQRQKITQNEKVIRDLHKELSIKLSDK